MKAVSSTLIALLIPATIFLHQLEEYFLGFPLWYSELLNTRLSNENFVLINAAGLFIFLVLVVINLFNKNNIIVVALGTLVFVNGVMHFALSIFTFSYSPGTITGSILFIPLGVLIYKRFLPKMPGREQIIAITIGILMLMAAAITAYTM